MDGIKYLTAGFVWVGLTAIGFALGFAVSKAFDSGSIAVVIGGVAGLVIGITTVHFMYVRPMQVEAREADYSHLTPLEDDDDDD